LPWQQLLPYLPPVSQNESELKELMKQEEYQEKASSSPFLYLSLDLPPPPLFQDELEKNIIPQVALFDLLSKFDGKSVKEYKTASESHVKRFELTKLPPFLILCIKRFTRNYFYLEKNPTIVNFPLKDIDMGEFLSRDPEVRKQHPQTKYNLVANICHDGQAGSGKGTYRVHVRHKGANQWFELQDLHVTSLQAQMITLAESYIQVYELQEESDGMDENR
jgi:U4/U6.U5 tri-snRNP-associated protein 2